MEQTNCSVITFCTPIGEVQSFCGDDILDSWTFREYQRGHYRFVTMCQTNGGWFLLEKCDSQNEIPLGMPLNPRSVIQRLWQYGCEVPAEFQALLKRLGLPLRPYQSQTWAPSAEKLIGDPRLVAVTNSDKPVIVLGKPREVLRPTPFEVVRVLCEHHDGLCAQQLNNLSRAADAPRALRKLKEQASYWNQVIRTPGKGCRGRYQFVCP
ncbi:MAG: hypothetical protein ACFCD0_27290 [Gemmataceae bacterium]